MVPRAYAILQISRVAFVISSSSTGQQPAYHYVWLINTSGFVTFAFALWEIGYMM